MYLKKLEMKGFKSFADKTEIIFEEGVTCVVGPNGSGKSNITDAVRWVLGEQRVKTLRGSKMEDIIFNGTKRRKPLGYAEVSLFFDNSNNVFPYDFSEVVVSRKLFRSGESEYSLNGCQCKLKEVKELFMDTGIGTDGYSIIGQGRIERILSNNKDERKQIFEEASGIAKYKSRKLESERKLQNTDLNLQRVEDIVNELSLRVGPLKTESDKAIEYKEISEKLREIEINQLVNVYDRNEKKLVSEKEKELDINSKIKSFNDSIEESKETYSEEIMKLDGANDRIENINKAHFDVQHSIKELEGEDNLLKERIKNKESEIKRISVDIDGGNDLIEQKNKEIFKLDSDKKTFFDEIKDLRDEKNLIEKNYSDILENYENIEKSVSEKKSKIIDTLNIIERENNDISNIDKNIEIFKNRSVEINRDLDITISKIRDNNKILFDKDKEIIEINKEIEKISDSKKKLQKSVDENKEELNDLNEELKRLESSITKFNSEREVLISMNEDYEGFDNSVRNALKKIF